MLQKIIIENFLSFEKAETIHFDNSKLKDIDYKGKTNILRSLYFLKTISAFTINPVKRYSHSYFRNKELSVIKICMKLEDQEYLYEVSFNSESITEEALYQIKNNHYKAIIKRSGKNITYAIEDYYMNFLVHEESSMLTLNRRNRITDPIKDIDLVSNFFSSMYFNKPEVFEPDTCEKFDLNVFSEHLNNHPYETSELLKILQVEDSEIKNIFINESVNYEGAETFCLFLDYGKKYLMPYYLMSHSIQDILHLFDCFNFNKDLAACKYFFADDYSNTMKEPVRKAIEQYFNKHGVFYYF